MMKSVSRDEIRLKAPSEVAAAAAKLLLSEDVVPLFRSLSGPRTFPFATHSETRLPSAVVRRGGKSISSQTSFAEAFLTGGENRKVTLQEFIGIEHISRSELSLSDLVPNPKSTQWKYKPEIGMALTVRRCDTTW
jgi:hypothetical protein